MSHTFKKHPQRKCVPLFSNCDSDLIKAAWATSTGGYAKRYFGRDERGIRKNIFAHRVVLSRVVGRPLTTNDICDHANGIRTDNRRENIRLTTRAGNSQNRVASGPMRGVSVTPNKRWMARVSLERNGKKFCLYVGTYDCKAMAAIAAKLKRMELGFFGE